VKTGKEYAKEVVGVLEEIKALSDTIGEIINEISGFLTFLTDLAGMFTSLAGGFIKSGLPSVHNAFDIMFDLVYMYELLEEAMNGEKGCCNGGWVDATEAIAELYKLLFDPNGKNLQALRDASLADREAKKEADDAVIQNALKEGKSIDDIDESELNSNPYTDKMTREMLYPTIQLHPFGIGSQMLHDQMLKTLYETDWLLTAIKEKHETIASAFPESLIEAAHSDLGICFGIGMKMPDVEKFGLSELKTTAMSLASLPAKLSSIAKNITDLQSSLSSLGESALTAAKSVVEKMTATEKAVEDAAEKSIRNVREIDQEDPLAYYNSHKLEVEYIVEISKLPASTREKAKELEKKAEETKKTADKLNPDAMAIRGEGNNKTNTATGWLISLVTEGAKAAKAIGDLTSKLSKVFSKLTALTSKVSKLATTATDPNLPDKMLGNAISDLTNSSIGNNVTKMLNGPSNVGGSFEKAVENMKKIAK